MLLLGNGLDTSAEFHVGRIPDDARSLDPSWSNAIAVPPLRVDGQSATIALPGDLPFGVYGLRVSNTDGATVSWLNLPEPWWIQGDEGGAASAGGWIRLFGTGLSFDRAAALALKRDGSVIQVKVMSGSPWNLLGHLPPDVAPGSYEVVVHNGYGGEASWRSAGRMLVVAASEEPTASIEVRADAGDGPEESAIREALARVARGGGGVVTLAPGVYDMQGTLEVPPGTVLRGPSEGGASLHWPDFTVPPEALLVVNDAAIENLSIYCRHHRVCVDSGSASKRFRMKAVRIRANNFFMQIQPGESYRDRQSPPKLGQGIAVRVAGRNFQITDCDIWCSGQGIVVDPHAFAGRNRPLFGVIRNNRIAYGSQGHLFENVDRLIFEDNEMFGCGSTAGGNAISTYWNNFARHIFYARNFTHDIHGVDRECPTLDGDGCAYEGTVKATGDRLTLAADPVFKDYAPQPHTDYRGAAVYVLSGAGAGQYRFVTAHEGREWMVDRPWDVSLDESSVLSIVPFRGRNIFCDNRCEDTGPLQLYGSAADVIVSGNTAIRTDGIVAWGLTQHGWGLHPVLRCQFLGNTLRDGSGAGARVAAAGIVVSAGVAADRYDGPMARGIVVRNNTLAQGMSIRVDGKVAAVLVEGNRLSDANVGIAIGPDVSAVSIQRNACERVGVELSRQSPTEPRSK